MRDDESVPVEVKDVRMVDEALTLTSQILLRRGFEEAAQAMLKIARTEVEYFYDYNEETRKLWVEYEPEHAAEFAKHDDTISDIFREVVRRKEFDLAWIEFREAFPDIYYGWRQQLVEVLRGQRRTNQARVVREQAPRWFEDGLYFTNPGELQVYRKLKSLQEEFFPTGDTIAIFPLPRGRIPGHTREPDFVVTYKGRTGVLEIDGPHHNVRRSHDTSSDHLYRDAGIAFVDRVSVEALSDPVELEEVLKRFLKRIMNSK
ncbi:hypothetical protein [Amycolatopsis alba]|uniref:hypothetical protein n=1 Tax=Amycolatopsis alba TaxID=76020 RepID=UPI0011775921|nr:hypothetical protein [Amycolatopsis alba]